MFYGTVDEGKQKRFIQQFSRSIYRSIEEYVLNEQKQNETANRNRLLSTSSE